MQYTALRGTRYVRQSGRGGVQGESRLLEACYRNSLTLAAAAGVRSIAFPSISTGAYGYPVNEAAKIAVRTVADFIKGNPDKFDIVVWTLFGEETMRGYDRALCELECGEDK